MICLFGGTFDPVHLGHLHAAAAVCRSIPVAEVRLVLSARPSHRDPTSASTADRWAMLCLACADDPRLIPDDREMLRDGPSYTVDTLRAVRAEAPSASIVWVLGSDAFALLPTWHRWREVLTLANLVVLARPGAFPDLDPDMQRLLETHRVESLAGCHEGGILVLQDAMEEIAAADVRRRLAAGRSVRQLLPEPVANYIRTHHLYGSS
ncbi:MAG: nicotinate-nucleotide adenylyltransferase [Pseudomonadales bacterium]